MTPQRRALLLAIASLICGCSMLTDFSADRFLERNEARCSDNIDNDDNGLIDCEDASCKRFDFCMENSATRCGDKKDNDADGLTDCEDSGCCGFAVCAMDPGCGERTASACTDGLDNDSNGLTDCADFSCTGPGCCRRLLPLLAETFDTLSNACSPQDCATQPEQCCGAETLQCNAFDDQRWIAWGLPPPRIADSAFSPNQPCVTCPVSGLLSVVDTTLSGGLHLELEADLKGDLDAHLSFGLVEKVVIPQTDLPCGSIKTPFPLLVGISLAGSQVHAEVGGIVRSTTTGTMSGPQQLQISVNADGAIEFLHNGKLFYTSVIRVQMPYPRVRLLLQGHSALATFDTILWARRSGCIDPGAWVAGPTGSGPAIIPDPDGIEFESSSIEDPSILLDGNTYRIYYTGRPRDSGESQLGLKASTDGKSWEALGSPLVIHGETSDNLSDPVVVRIAPEYIMAYRRTSTSGQPSIAIATSADGVSWSRESTAVTVGHPGAWDGGDVDAPAMLRFRNQLFLWYIGRGQQSTIPKLGLATSFDNRKFSKSSFNPILAANGGNLDDRGIADPWIDLEGETLRMWYVGLTWGDRTTINHAVSEDGRNWIRYPANPLIGANDSSLFGANTIRGPTVLDRWGTLHMWYGGVGPSGRPSIGHATNTSTAGPPLP